MRFVALFLVLCIASSARATTVTVTTNFMTEIQAALSTAAAEPLIIRLQSSSPIQDCYQPTINLADTDATSITIELLELGTRGSPFNVDCAAKASRTTPMFVCDDCPPTTFHGFSLADLSFTTNVFGIHGAFVEVLAGTVTLSEMTFYSIYMNGVLDFTIFSAFYDCVTADAMATFILGVGVNSHVIVAETTFEDSEYQFGWIAATEGATANVSSCNFIENDIDTCFGQLIVANGSTATMDGCHTEETYNYDNYLSDVVVFGGSNIMVTDMVIDDATDRNSFLSSANVDLGAVSSDSFYVSDEIGNHVTIERVTVQELDVAFSLHGTHFTMTDSSVVHDSESIVFDESYVIGCAYGSASLSGITTDRGLVTVGEGASLYATEITAESPTLDLVTWAVFEGQSADHIAVSDSDFVNVSYVARAVGNAVETTFTDITVYQVHVAFQMFSDGGEFVLRNAVFENSGSVAYFQGSATLIENILFTDEYRGFFIPVIGLLYCHSGESLEIRSSRFENTFSSMSVDYMLVVTGFCFPVFSLSFVLS